MLEALVREGLFLLAIRRKARIKIEIKISITNTRILRRYSLNSCTLVGKKVSFCGHGRGTPGDPFRGGRRRRNGERPIIGEFPLVTPTAE